MGKKKNKNKKNKKNTPTKAIRSRSNNIKTSVPLSSSLASKILTTTIGDKSVSSKKQVHPAQSKIMSNNPNKDKHTPFVQFPNPNPSLKTAQKVDARSCSFSSIPNFMRGGFFGVGVSGSTSISNISGINDSSKFSRSRFPSVEFEAACSHWMRLAGEFANLHLFPVTNGFADFVKKNREKAMGLNGGAMWCGPFVADRGETDALRKATTVSARERRCDIAAASLATTKLGGYFFQKINSVEDYDSSGPTLIDESLISFPFHQDQYEKVGKSMRFRIISNHLKFIETMLAKQKIISPENENDHAMDIETVGDMFIGGDVVKLPIGRENVKVIDASSKSVSDLVLDLSESSSQIKTLPRIGVINAANAYTPGGGFATGGRHALEEALCTQSTLFTALNDMYNKVCNKENKQSGKSATAHIRYLDEFDIVATPNVEFFRYGTNRGYEFWEEQESKVATVFSLSMYNRNPNMNGTPVDFPSVFQQMDPSILFPRPNNAREKKSMEMQREIALNHAYEEGIEKKFDILFKAADQFDVSSLILCDIGCGVYANDPTMMGTCLRKSIAKIPCTSSVRTLYLTGDRRFIKEAGGKDGVAKL